MCAYEATRFMGVGNFDLSYDNIEGGAFWGFAYGYAQEFAFAYPLAFEMEPVVCKFSENSCDIFMHFSLCLFIQWPGFEQWIKLYWKLLERLISCLVSPVVIDQTVVEHLLTLKTSQP